MKQTDSKWKLISCADEARDQQNWSLAAKNYEAALSIDPVPPAIWVQLGHARKESGDLERGLVAYIEALRRDITHDDAWEALIGLKWSRAEILKSVNGEKIPLEPKQPAPKIYDITDLIMHLTANRSPTGIQRVQVQLVRALLEIDPFGVAAAYDVGVRGWLYMPPSMFQTLTNLISSDTSTNESSWKNFIGLLRTWRHSGAEIHFATQSALLNLGSSWAAEGYMDSLFRLQKTHEIRYYPFVHDLIPVRYPESCAPGLPAAFNLWLLASKMQARKFLVSSHAVGRDLVEYGGANSSQVLPPIRLDGPFNKGGIEKTAVPPFVLIVSTLENRKNHRLAFKVWDRLVRERGLSGTPILRCIGKDGPGSDDIRNNLKNYPNLRGVVNIAGPLSDADLASSYCSCLFVLCPSIYEGWGLPISEALSFGVPVIASRVGGQPEAGGQFAVYFESENAEELYQCIRSYLDSPRKLTIARIKIKMMYRPRSWAKIARDLLQCIET